MVTGDILCVSKGIHWVVKLQQTVFITGLDKNALDKGLVPLSKRISIY